MKEEGRIFDHDLTHYNTSRAVFAPAGMSARELEEGYLRVYRRFYAWESIFRRFPKDPRRNTPYLLFNVGYRKLGAAAAALGALGLMRAAGRAGARVSYSLSKRLGL